MKRFWCRVQTYSGVQNWMDPVYEMWNDPKIKSYLMVFLFIVQRKITKKRVIFKKIIYIWWSLIFVNIWYEGYIIFLLSLFYKNFCSHHKWYICSWMNIARRIQFLIWHTFLFKHIYNRNMFTIYSIWTTFHSTQMS